MKIDDIKKIIGDRIVELTCDIEALGPKPERVELLKLNQALYDSITASIKYDQQGILRRQ